MLDDRPLVETGLPRAGRITVRRQPAFSRDVVHLMLATPVLRGELRGDNVQPIQDFVDLRDVSVELAANAAVTDVRVVPGGQGLEFRQDAGRLHFVLPSLRGHAAIEVVYETE